MIHTELSVESVAALRSLLGATIHTIYSPRLDAAGPQLAAPSLSFLLSKDEFLDFSCVWSETHKSFIDSWQLEASRATQPKGIRVDETGALLPPLSTISMYEAEPIERIEVYEQIKFFEAEEADSVRYDQALVFQHGNRRFCIACSLNGPGCADDLKFSEDETVINKLLKGSSLRLTLER